MNLHYVGKWIKEDTGRGRGGEGAAVDEKKAMEMRSWADRGDGWKCSEERAHAEKQKNGVESDRDRGKKTNMRFTKRRIGRVGEFNERIPNDRGNKPVSFSWSNWSSGCGRCSIIGRGGGEEPVLSALTPLYFPVSLIWQPCCLLTDSSSSHVLLPAPTGISPTGSQWG